MNALTDGRSNEWSQSAVWADDIKYGAFAYYDQWHWYDRPVNPNMVYNI